MLYLLSENNGLIRSLLPTVPQGVTTAALHSVCCMTLASVNPYPANAEYRVSS